MSGYSETARQLTHIFAGSFALFEVLESTFCCVQLEDLEVG